MKTHSRFNKNAALVAVMAIVVVALAVFFMKSKPREARANPPDAPAQGDITGTQPVLELTQEQIKSIKIQQVGTYSSPVEKEAVGSIGFDEDQTITSAESTLISAAATYELTTKELARAKNLLGTNGVSQREVEQAVSDQQTAGAALKAARDAVRVLGKTDEEIERMVAAGKIDSLGDGTKWVVANVTEGDSPLIHPGEAVKVGIVSLAGRDFQGKVSKVYATVDPNTHRMPIRCEIDDPNDETRPGMLASVVFQVKEPVESAAIPVNGVVREGDGTLTAWVTTDRRHFTQRIVKIGLQKDGKYQVLDGLKAGETAVIDGAIFLDNMLQAPSDDD